MSILNFNQIPTKTTQEMIMDKSKILSTAYLEKNAPSIFAANPHKDRSAKYHFIPTAGVLDIFQKKGWLPVKVMEQRVNKEDKRGFQKHIVRLRNFDQDLTFKGNCIELVLVNSHDGTSAYQLHAGVFRIVCLNGMVVGDSLFPRISVRHHGQQEQDFIDVSYKIIEDVPKITEQISIMNSLQLAPEEKEGYAQAALALKYGEEQPPISYDQLLAPRRTADKADDLYTVYNTVQENIIKGGLFYRTGKGQYRHTRPVKSINEDLRLNKALWVLTERMRELKAA